MRKSSKFNLNIIEPNDVINENVINENNDILADEIVKAMELGYDIANLANQKNADYRAERVSDTITETVSKNGKELAKRVTTKLSNGDIKITTSGANYNQENTTIYRRIREGLITAEVR